MDSPKRIPADKCEHGFLYRIHSRNLSLGVCRKEKNHVGFIGIRTKFGDRYLFEELHWGTSEHYGTVSPIECLEKCPVEHIVERYDDGKCFVQNKALFNYLEEARERLFPPIQCPKCKKMIDYFSWDEDIGMCWDCRNKELKEAYDKKKNSTL